MTKNIQPGDYVQTFSPNNPFAPNFRFIVKEVETIHGKSKACCDKYGCYDFDLLKILKKGK